MHRGRKGEVQEQILWGPLLLEEEGGKWSYEWRQRRNGQRGRRTANKGQYHTDQMSEVFAGGKGGPECQKQQRGQGV